MQNTAIQTGWIKRWRSVSGVNPAWRQLAQNNFLPLGEKISDCNINSADINFLFLQKYCNVQNCWRELGIAWCNVHFHKPCNKENILNQILWINSHIGVNGVPVFYQDWHSAGVIFVKD